MSTDDESKRKSSGSGTAVTIVVALISALVTIIVAFKDPISARLFPTPTPIPPAQVSAPTAIFLPSVQVTESVVQSLPTEAAPTLQFEPCAINLACPDALPIFQVIGKPDPYESNIEYSASITSHDFIRFSSGWCTYDQQLLYENLQHIRFIFAIDGVSYADKLGSQYNNVPSSEDPNMNLFCYNIGIGVSNWQSGALYTISIGPVLDMDLYDGKDTTNKGAYPRIFVLTVK